MREEGGGGGGKYGAFPCDGNLGTGLCLGMGVFRCNGIPSLGTGTFLGREPLSWDGNFLFGRGPLVLGREYSVATVTLVLGRELSWDGNACLGTGTFSLGRDPLSWDGSITLRQDVATFSFLWLNLTFY